MIYKTKKKYNVCVSVDKPTFTFDLEEIVINNAFELFFYIVDSSGRSTKRSVTVNTIPVKDKPLVQSGLYSVLLSVTNSSGIIQGLIRMEGSATTDKILVDSIIFQTDELSDKIIERGFVFNEYLQKREFVSVEVLNKHQRRIQISPGESTVLWLPCNVINPRDYEKIEVIGYSCVMVNGPYPNMPTSVGPVEVITRIDSDEECILVQVPIKNISDTLTINMVIPSGQKFIDLTMLLYNKREVT